MLQRKLWLGLLFLKHYKKYWGSYLLLNVLHYIPKKVLLRKSKCSGLILPINKQNLILSPLHSKLKRLPNIVILKEKKVFLAIFFVEFIVTGYLLSAMRASLDDEAIFPYKMSYLLLLISVFLVFIHWIILWILFFLISYQYKLSKKVMYSLLKGLGNAFSGY